MPTKKKTKVSPEIVAKAKQVLEFAEQRAQQSTYRSELHNALFAVNGKATEMFPTENERAAFLRTNECERIFALMDTLPWPPPSGDVYFPDPIPETIRPAKKKAKVTPEIVAKAKQVLEFTEQRAKQAADRSELRNALFTVNGKATELFPTESERGAFVRTAEYKRILALIDTLPWPPAKGDVYFPAMSDSVNHAPRQR